MLGTEEVAMYDARTPRANENFPDDSQETL